MNKDKNPNTQLVGVDVYIITKDGIPCFDYYGAFKCEFISNRGTKVWPGFVSPDLLLVDWYRCRFTVTGDIEDEDVDAFLAKLSEKWLWSGVQKLWRYDGEPGYSKPY